MDSYHARIVGEIEERLNSLSAHAKVWDPVLITMDVCNAHRDGLVQGDGGIFWEWAGHRYVREMVRKQINSRVGGHVTPAAPQLHLPGFERDRLQYYYTVERDGRELHVPVTEMADDEIDIKAEAYRKMGAACYAHADELDRFRVWRHQALV